MWYESWNENFCELYGELEWLFYEFYGLKCLYWARWKANQAFPPYSNCSVCVWKTPAYFEGHIPDNFLINLGNSLFLSKLHRAQLCSGMMCKTSIIKFQFDENYFYLDQTILPFFSRRFLQRPVSQVFLIVGFWGFFLRYSLCLNKQ